MAGEHRYFWYFLRAAGVVFVGISLPATANSLGALYGILHTIIFPPPANTVTGMWSGVNYAFGFAGNNLVHAAIRASGPILQFVFGVYLLFRGRLLMRLCVPDIGARCPVCEYDLRRNSSGKCPECGCEIRPFKAAHADDEQQ